jgi:Putative O-antigen polymerase
VSLYASSLALLLGCFIFLGLTWLVPVYFGLTYFALSLSLWSGIRANRDVLNPLALIIVIEFIRFSIPAFLVWLGVDPDIRIFEDMGIRNQDWMMGHILILFGLLGFVTGWFLELRLSPRLLRKLETLTFYRYGGLPLATTFCMAVGFIGLALFVRSNISIEAAVVTGELRETEIQAGAGKFFFLAFLLSAGSAVFTTYLNDRRCSLWIIILPALFSMMSFAVLGGRAMAIAPVAAAGLILWYKNQAAKALMKVWLVLSIPLLLIFSYVGQIYRGGLGIQGVVQAFSLSALIDYANWALWVDWGNLHAMAAAIMIGPGELEGRTFSILLWPLSKFFDVGGKSAGVFMVQTLLPHYVLERKWAFHPTLIGDAYLNYGVVGVVIATVIFGILLRILYDQIRMNVANTAIYAIAVVQCLRLFYESIEKFPETLVLLVFAVFIAQLGRALTLPMALNVPNSSTS